MKCVRQLIGFAVLLELVKFISRKNVHCRNRNHTVIKLVACHGRGWLGHKQKMAFIARHFIVS